MKASELRIGNIVLRPNGLPQISKPIRIDVVRAIGFLGELDLGWREYLADKCCGVPLTDEILRDWCGFNKALRVEGLTKHGIDLVPAGDAYYDNRTGRKITTLHQLQNYVYALTGEELEVKLPTQQP